MKNKRIHPNEAILKSLKKLQDLCRLKNISVVNGSRLSKQPYIVALQEHFWNHDGKSRPLPPQIQPMLLSDWNDLDEPTRQHLENDLHEWIVQEKFDGVRVLVHIEENGIRITGRNFSESNFRLTEFQDNLTHLAAGLTKQAGTILDGELVCPVSKLDTGKTITTSPLQAAVAILATSSDNAARIQQDDRCKLRLYVFDILKFSGRDVTAYPLCKRLDWLSQTIRDIENPFIELVPCYSVNKKAVYDNILAAGGEGTVWKKVDAPYEPGKRVGHWLKRKREIQVEAFVSGFKLGTPGLGNENTIGAIEFSIRCNEGLSYPIAWVIGWSDAERQGMTLTIDNGRPTLKPDYFGRRAIVVAQDEAGRSGRLRHARFKCWMTTPTASKNTETSFPE